MNKTTICFDLDGTLTDPKPGITRSIQYALEKLGHPAPEEDELTWCIGPPLLGSFATLVGEADAEYAVQHYRDRFGDLGYRENELYPGIIEVLAALGTRDIQLLVATSKPTFYARKIIEHFGLASYFEDVCGSELDGTRADKTDLLAWIVAKKGLEPGATAMIGDRRHDVIGARNNAIDAVAVLYGYGSRDELSEAGAAHLCERPGDLPAVLAAL